MNRLRQSDVKALYHDLRTKSDDKNAGVQIGSADYLSEPAGHLKRCSFLF